MLDWKKSKLIEVIAKMGEEDVERVEKEVKKIEEEGK